jgi:hypothetical protein
MALQRIFVGIDVSKDWLELWLEPPKRFERVGDDSAGVEADQRIYTPLPEQMKDVRNITQRLVLSRSTVGQPNAELINQLPKRVIMNSSSAPRCPNRTSTAPPKRLC